MYALHHITLHYTTASGSDASSFISTDAEAVAAAGDLRWTQSANRRRLRRHMSWFDLLPVFACFLRFLGSDRAATVDANHLLHPRLRPLPWYPSIMHHQCQLHHQQQQPRHIDRFGAGTTAMLMLCRSDSQLTHTQTYMCANTHTHTNASTHTQAHTNKHINASTHIHTQTQTHTHTHIQ